MRTRLCTEKPDEITFNLTITATAKEFEQLRDQIADISQHPAMFPAALFAVMAVFALTIEGIGQRNAEHDRCLKHATNGYEIKQCR